MHATFLSLPDGELRNDMQRALARSEQDIIARGAKIYQRLSELLGYRLRAELDATFETLASLVSATMRGLVVMAPAVPGIATRHIQAAPFGAAGTAEWSQPALGITSIALSFLEPDPAVEWNDERLATVRQALMSEDALMAEDAFGLHRLHRRA